MTESITPKQVAILAILALVLTSSGMIGLLLLSVFQPYSSSLFFAFWWCTFMGITILSPLARAGWSEAFTLRREVYEHDGKGN